MRKKLTAFFHAAVLTLLVQSMAFGAGFFEQGQAPVGGYPSSPTFTHVGTGDINATDNVVSSKGLFSSILRRGGFDVYTVNDNAAIAGLPNPALDNLTDGSYNKTARLLDLVLKGGITGVHPSLGTNAVLIGPSGGTFPADQSVHGHFIRGGGVNVITIQNTNGSSYSAIRAVDNNGIEKGAWGYGNSPTDSFARQMYLESFNYNADNDNTAQFMPLAIKTTIVGGHQTTWPGYPDDPRKAFIYDRLKFNEDGTISFYDATSMFDNTFTGASVERMKVVAGGVKVIGSLDMTGSRILTPTDIYGFSIMKTWNQNYPTLTLISSDNQIAMNTPLLRLSSNEGSQPFVVGFDLIGAAALADRMLKIQTAQPGVGSNGIISLQPNGGRVGIGTTTPVSKLAVVGLLAYANNTTAVAGGLVAGDFYRTGGDPDVVCVVH